MNGYETPIEAAAATTVAGDVGPGFYIWPTGHILQDTDTNALIRNRFPAQKTFGETFGAATGVGAPSDRRKAES